MKVILTGATGFVGQNISKYLEKSNIHVHVLSMRDEHWRSRINQQAQALIHLAGKAHDTSNTSDASEYFKVNTELTIELFNEFLKSEVNDFIYFSSVKAVADTVDGVLKENIKADPKTPYGQSKLKAEEYLLKQLLPVGKRLIILRPCMIHGPGNKGNLNLLYKVVVNGIPYPLGAFKNERSFLSIDNLNFIIHKILNDSAFPSGVYNIADDIFLSTNQLIKIIGEASRSKARVWYISKSLISATARIGDKLKLPLNSERLKKLTESYVVSNNKIKQALNIKELPVNARDGLIKTIKSF